MPSSDGDVPLAQVMMHRDVQVALTGGSSVNGHLEGITWLRAPDGLTPTFEVVKTDGETVLLAPSDVASIDGQAADGSVQDVVREVSMSLTEHSVDPGDIRQWEVPIGPHEFLEVTIRRETMPCQPPPSPA